MIEYVSVEKRMETRDAGPRIAAELCLGRGSRRIYPRRRAGSPNPIDGKPADQAAGGRFRASLAQSDRQAGGADGRWRTSFVLRATATRAGGRGPRRAGAAG